MTQDEKTEPVSAALDISKQVTEALKNSTEILKARVVATLTESELASRVDLLLKGLNKVKEAKKELDKLRSDVETFDEEGKKIASVYSKAKMEERKKAREGLEKLENAVEKALAGESFDKLKELVSK